MSESAVNIASEWQCASLTWWEPRLLFLPWASFFSPCQTRGCHWSGKRADRPAHQRVCLVTRINNLRLYVDELEDAILEYDKKVLDLETAWEEQMRLNEDLRAEMITLKEQSELDKGVIESLRLQLGSGLAASSSMRMSRLETADDVVAAISENGLDESDEEGQDGALEIWLAAQRGDMASIQEMLENMTSKESNKSSHGLGSALHIAASCGHARVVELLLERGDSDVANALDDEGNSALHIAALNGHQDVVRVLLACPKFRCVCLPNVAARTVLHCAAVQGNQEIVKMLLLHYGLSDEAVNALAEEDMPYSFEKVQVTTEEGVTALHLAAKFGHVGVVQVLLETDRFKVLNEATVNLRYTALHIAARYWHCTVSAALLQNGRFDAVNATNLNGDTALHVAVGYGNSDVAKLLLENPRFTSVPHQNARDQATALHSAAIGGHAETTRLLLTATRFPSSAVNAKTKDGNSALHNAAWFGHCDVVEELLNSNRFASVSSQNKFGSTALLAAAFKGHSRISEILLASPRFTASSLPNSAGYNALHLAIVQGHSEVVEALLSSSHFDSSTVNAVTLDDGLTALHLAVQLRRVPVAYLLLQCQRFSAILATTARDGRTALHLAAARRESLDASSLVEALLGSDRFTAEASEARDKSGCTALHLMVERGHFEAAQMLQKSGKFTAVGARQGRHNRSALDIAKARADTQMVSLLESWSQ